MKTIKNLFLYSLLLIVLVLLTSFIPNIQGSGTGNAGSDQVMALESQSQRQECGEDARNDFGGIGSGNETGDSTNDLSCSSEARATNHELASILLFGTALIGAGVAVRRLRF